MVSISMRLLVAGIILAALIACPVAADLLNPTVTHVYFEKDGAPYNGSVTFSVNCTGCYWDRTIWKVPENCKQEEVFSYAANCPAYGCVIYETFYLNYRETYRCDLFGETEGRKFSIPNFSTTPVPPDCTPVEYTAVTSGNDTAAGQVSPVYEACMARYSLKDCEKFLVPCKQEAPAQDEGDCGWYTSAENKTMKTTPAFGTCLNNTREQQKSCDAYLEPASDTAAPVWKSGDAEMPAERTCELRFTIPSDVPEEGQASPVPALPGTNPFASLYCRLPLFSGNRC